MPSQEDVLGRLKIAVLRRRLDGTEFRTEKSIRIFLDIVRQAETASDTVELIKIIDRLYNSVIDPMFERRH